VPAPHACSACVGGVTRNGRTVVQVRVALPKEERKRLRTARRAAQAGRALADDFADDVQGLLAMGDAPHTRALTDKLRLGQQYGGALARDAGTHGGGGMPLRLHKRRTRFLHMHERAPG
jgi:hypothetical protein